MARYELESPEGKVWAATSTHVLVMVWAIGPGGRARWSHDRAAAIDDAKERVSAGVVPCDNEACDYCHPPEE
jgi:hypothetical protein